MKLPAAIATHLTAVGLGAGLGVALLVLWRSDHQGPALPPAIVTRLDSVKITRPLDSAWADSVRQAAAREVARARAASQQAAKLRQVGDSLVRAAEIGLYRSNTADSTIADTRRALTDAIAGAKKLQAAYDSIAAANARLAAAKADADARSAKAEARATALDNLNRDVARDAERARQCRIIGPIGCPTRMQTAIGVVALVEGLRIALGRP